MYMEYIASVDNKETPSEIEDTEYALIGNTHTFVYEYYWEEELSTIEKYEIEFFEESNKMILSYTFTDCDISLEVYDSITEEWYPATYEDEYKEMQIIKTSTGYSQQFVSEKIYRNESGEKIECDDDYIWYSQLKVIDENDAFFAMIGGVEDPVERPDSIITNYVEESFAIQVDEEKGFVLENGILALQV